MNTISLILALCCFILPAYSYAGTECTEYVASAYDITSYPHAKGWYNHSGIIESGYTQSNTPIDGAIVVFDSWGTNDYGHVGIMKNAGTGWDIDHANWNDDGEVNGRMSIVSADNWNSAHINGGNKSYPIIGFLIPPNIELESTSSCSYIGDRTILRQDGSWYTPFICWSYNEGQSSACRDAFFWAEWEVTHVPMKKYSYRIVTASSCSKADEPLAFQSEFGYLSEVHYRESLGLIDGVDPPDPQSPTPDPVNLTLDFDIQDPNTRKEFFAGQDNLKPGQIIRLNVKLEAEKGNAEDWMEENKAKVETDFYVRYNNGDWQKLGRQYTRASNLDKGEEHTEHMLLTIPRGTRKVSFYVKTDAEKELTETDEGDNVSRIETFRVRGKGLSPQIIMTILD